MTKCHVVLYNEDLHHLIELFLVMIGSCNKNQQKTPRTCCELKKAVSQTVCDFSPFFFGFGIFLAILLIPDNNNLSSINSRTPRKITQTSKMSQRLKTLFEEKKAQKKPIFVSFVTGGFPTPKDSVQILLRFDLLQTCIRFLRFMI